MESDVWINNLEEKHTHVRTSFCLVLVFFSLKYTLAC